MSIPDNVALMRMIVAAPDRAALEADLEHADPALRRLWRANPQAWPLLRGVLAADQTDAAALFDRAVAVSPEAGVALYSLGRADLLDQATAEIVELLSAEGLIGPDRRVLEIGCGFGRFLEPIAATGATVVGLDVSMGMLGEAARRSRAIRAVRGSGRDLACVADAALDLVLAVDSFPYLDAAAHMAEAARVLRPGGVLLVLNWSYRGDGDEAEAQRLAAAHGFTILTCGPGPFRHWDGRVFHLRRWET